MVESRRLRNGELWGSPLDTGEVSRNFRTFHGSFSLMIPGFDAAHARLTMGQTINIDVKNVYALLGMYISDRRARLGLSLGLKPGTRHIGMLLLV